MNPDIPVELLQALADSAYQEGCTPDVIVVSSADLAAVLRAGDVPVTFKTGDDDKTPRMLFRVLFVRDDEDDASPDSFLTVSVGHGGAVAEHTSIGTPYHDNSDEGARDQLLRELNEAILDGLRVSDVRYVARVKGSTIDGTPDEYTHMVLMQAPFDSITAFAEHLQEQGYDQTGIAGRFQVTSMVVPQFAGQDLTIVGRSSNI